MMLADRGRHLSELHSVCHARLQIAIDIARTEGLPESDLPDWCEHVLENQTSSDVPLLQAALRHWRTDIKEK